MGRQIGSSIAKSEDGKFRCIIHWVSGNEVKKFQVDHDDVIQTGPWVESIEQAMAIGSRYLDELETGFKGELH